MSDDITTVALACLRAEGDIRELAACYQKLAGALEALRNDTNQKYEDVKKGIEALKELILNHPSTHPIIEESPSS